MTRLSNIQSELEANLNSPRPLLVRVRNLIFGTQQPDNYTKFTFFLAIAIWFIFFVWSVVSAIVIRLGDTILDNKEIDVVELIENRGKQLGFESGEFIGRLEAFHALSVVFWGITFVGLVLLWRKNVRFTYFFFTGCGLYFVFLLTMLGFQHYIHDTTSFDKIAFAVLVIQTAIYAFFRKREEKILE